MEQSKKVVQKHVRTFNDAFFLSKEARAPQWVLIDATGLHIGRLATQIAEKLRGKDKPYYTPHTDCGDYVVVINADQAVFTGNKWDTKIYADYSGWRGGLKERVAKDVVKKHPEMPIERAVKGMLPKNKLSDQVIKKLFVYGGSEHPHAAQAPQKVTVTR